MDTVQWPHQDIIVRPMEETIVTNKSSSSSVERKVRPQKEQAVNCPRCNSTNTKFCYYNNYSLSQPRYFCKTCRRYWTEGGSLRNIPVGGGSRKNKRQSTNSLNSNSSKKLPDLVPPPQQQNPKINDTTQDLNLGIYPNTPHHQFINQLPNFDHNGTTREFQIDPSSSSPSALELLTGITSATRGLSSFIQMNNDPNTSHHVYNSSSSPLTGFPLPAEFRPSLNFSLDGIGSNYGSFQGVQESSGKHLLFPFEDLKQVSSGNNNNNANDGDDQQNGEQNGGADSSGYWNGVIGGGSW